MYISSSTADFKQTEHKTITVHLVRHHSHSGLIMARMAYTLILF